MLVPKYNAYIKRFIFQPVIGWHEPYSYSYTRTHAYNEAKADFWVLQYHVPVAYTLAQAWYPVMATPLGISDTLEGQVNTGEMSGIYTELEPAKTADMIYADGHWTVQRLLEKQIPIWEESLVHHKAFLEALQARVVDDTWITNKVHIAQYEYDADVTAGSYEKTTNLMAPANFVLYPQVNTNYSVDPPLDTSVIGAEVTPCSQRYFVKANKAEWQVQRTTETFIATAEDAPLVERMPVVEVASYASYSTDPVPEEEKIYINGIVSTGRYFADIQPWTRNNRLSSADRRLEIEAEFASYVATLVAWDLAHPDANVTFEITEEATTVLNYYAAESQITSEFYTTQELTQWFPSWGTTLGADILQTSTTEHPRLTFGGDDLVGIDLPVVSPVTANIDNRTFVLRDAWDHTNPAFDGYVPFHGKMWSNSTYLAEVVAYAQNPDGRYDGLYFAFKVKTANIMRAWYCYVRWVEGASSVADYFLEAQLESNGLLNTETGEVTGGGYCYSITPVTFDMSSYLTPDFLQNLSIPNYNWSSYTYTLGAGEFFLQQGSAAPLYPTFKGAYVYDTHLQKWGKFVADYAKLIDYQAINTYQPGEQSYGRFGIYGGIVDGTGKIKLFDDAPVDAEIVYGKMGYYRQGMTTTEEWKVQHRTPLTGKITTYTSLDGKVMSPALTMEHDFISSGLWHATGGYSGRWHSIKLSGQFDLTYIEFRGIIQGKR